MTTRICEADEPGIAEAVAELRAGGCVAVPTETVYGLAAAGLDARACAGIFEAKGRPLSDPLILHVPDLEWLDRVAEVSPVARQLVERFWPGPLTLILQRRAWRGAGSVPDLVTAGQGTVAVRMSAHPVLAAVLAEFDGPVAAPSANRFGRISPTTAAHVVEKLGGRIPLILDGGACGVGIESTIVRVTGTGALQILRPGPVTADELAEFGEVGVSGGGDGSGPVAPGMMKSHYAPATPLDLVARVPEEGDADTGVLLFAPMAEEVRGYRRVEVLSATGDLREAAANLYGAMRRLDACGATRLLAGPVPEAGIGAAIGERLRKAAAR